MTINKQNDIEQIHENKLQNCHEACCKYARYWEKKMIARHIWGCVLGNARYFAFKLGISKVSENQAAATTRAEFLNFTNTSTSTCEIF